MGVVYTAQDPRLKRQVAIKLLTPDLTRDDTAKQRFLQEAQAASALDHPNICTIYEINETDDGRLGVGKHVLTAHSGGCCLNGARRHPPHWRTGSPRALGSISTRTTPTGIGSCPNLRRQISLCGARFDV